MSQTQNGPRVDTAAARALQLELRSRRVDHPPPRFSPATIAGADVSMNRFSRIGHGGIAVLDAVSHEPRGQAGVTLELGFPYVPGLLSFRELPLIEAAWARLSTKPDVLIFDGHGYAHPRRFGLACHGGVIFDLPSVGCAKSLLIGTHGPLGTERGSTAPLEHEGEIVGMAVRTRTGVRPVYVSTGHRMDLPRAVEIVLSAAPRYREPETTRAAHRLVNDMRRAAAEGSGSR